MRINGFLYLTTFKKEHSCSISKHRLRGPAAAVAMPEVVRECYPNFVRRDYGENVNNHTARTAKERIIRDKHKDLDEMGF